MVVTAAGFLVGLADQSLTLAIVLAVVAWLGRMVVAIAQVRRRGRRLPVVTIDPFAVSEPWRQYVRQALAARQRFDQAISGWPDGPLHDRLVLLQPRLDRATEEVWSVAQRGAALDGTVRGVPTGAARTSTEQLSGELPGCRGRATADLCAGSPGVSGSFGGSDRRAVAGRSPDSEVQPGRRCSTGSGYSRPGSTKR